jgi:hypothetical protein
MNATEPENHLHFYNAKKKKRRREGKKERKKERENVLEIWRCGTTYKGHDLAFLDQFALAERLDPGPIY